MTGIIGFACLLMAVGMMLAEPLDFHPDPFLQGLVWLGFAVWCFVTAWQHRDWRPPADEG